MSREKRSLPSPMKQDSLKKLVGTGCSGPSDCKGDGNRCRRKLASQAYEPLLTRCKNEKNIKLNTSIICQTRAFMSCWAYPESEPMRLLKEFVNRSVNPRHRLSGSNDLQDFDIDQENAEVFACGWFAGKYAGVSEVTARSKEMDKGDRSS